MRREGQQNHERNHASTCEGKYYHDITEDEQDGELVSRVEKQFEKTQDKTGGKGIYTEEEVAGKREE